MPIVKCAGQMVVLDDEGFLTDPLQWTPAVAEVLAEEEGISPLSEEHWKVLTVCREEAARRGKSPGAWKLSRLSGVSIDDLKRLFASAPENLAARIAGLHKPELS